MQYMRVPRPADPLDAAIRYFNTAAGLAAELGYASSATICNWKSRQAIPRVAAMAIEHATNGEVTALELSASYTIPLDDSQ